MISVNQDYTALFSLPTVSLSESLAIIFALGFKSELETSPASQKERFVISTALHHGHTDPQFSHVSSEGIEGEKEIVGIIVSS